MTEKSLIDEKFSDIEYNLKAIREDIAEAAIKSGRRPEDIDFMAVTKTVDEMYINHAIDCGITLIGENKVQEMLRKKPNLKLTGVRKNLIGHFPAFSLIRLCNAPPQSIFIILFAFTHYHTFIFWIH